MLILLGILLFAALAVAAVLLVRLVKKVQRAVPDARL
jgi:hypothetical protein